MSSATDHPHRGERDERLRAVDPDRFFLVTRIDAAHAEEIAPPRVWSRRHGEYRDAVRAESAGREYALFEVDASLDIFDELGNARIACSARDVYLLAGYRGIDPGSLMRADLRRLALCYVESGARLPEIVLGPASHRVRCFTREEADAHLRLSLYGEDFLGVPGASVLVDGEERPTVWGSDGETVTLEAGDGEGNTIRGTIRPEGDRLGCALRYEVTIPVDRDVEVALRLVPRAPLAGIETLHWSTRHDRLAVQSPADESPILLCQYPLVLGRFADGGWIGVFDHDLANIYVTTRPGGETSRGAEAGRDLLVAQAFWPHEPRTYEWSFELLAGYASYPNALLRAAYPYTKENAPFTDGFMAYGPLLDPAAAARNGVRAVYRHGWPYRNGVYYGEFGHDETYLNFWDQEFSYDSFADEIAAAKREGIRVLPYTQFTGVSEDVAGRFAGSLIRDARGEQQVVGRDGRYRNIWANPDPDREYGSSFLEQAEGILGELGAGGIAMDRTDRFDNRMKRGLFDLSKNDGYASVYPHDGARPPASPIAVQGKRMLLRLREILDRHDGVYVANIPRAFLVYRLADGVKGDIPHSPWALFFLKALSNGKCLFMHDRIPIPGQQFSPDPAWTASQLFLAKLWRAHAVVNPDHGPHQDWRPSRLLYVVPDGSDYPRTLLFADGASTLEFDYSVFEAGLGEVGPFTGDVGPANMTFRTYPGLTTDRYRGSITTIREDGGHG